MKVEKASEPAGVGKELAKGKIAAVVIILIIGGTAGYFFYRDFAQGIVTLSVTDPPSGQSGGNPHYDASILHIYVPITEVDLHQSGFGSTNDTGWHSVVVGFPRVVDMMSILNSSKALASTNLATGSYDQLRIPVTSVTVTLSTVGNITYIVPGGSLRIAIAGGGFQSSPGARISLLMTVSFDSNEILAMNGHLTPHVTAQIVA